MNTLNIGNSPLVVERNAPAALANAAHHTRSDRYGFIPTSDLIKGLSEHGWQVSSAQQAKCRTLDKRAYTKHLLRFRNAELPQVDDSAPELLLINSHDGSSSYTMRAGYFRFVCANGLIVGEDIFPALRVRHGKNALQDVIEGTYNIIKSVPDVVERIGDMRALVLSPSEQRIFADVALPLRFEGVAPITVDQVLRPRRAADTGRDIWSTFNVIQENLVKGNVLGRNANNQRRRTREVTGIDGNVKLNTALWTLAEEMRKLKAA